MSDSQCELELLPDRSGWRHWEMEHFDRSHTSGPPSSGLGGPATAARPKVAARKADPVDADAPRVDDEARHDDPRERIAKERLEAKAAGYKEGFEKARKEGFESGLAAGRKAVEKEIEQARRDVLTPLRAMADEYGGALDRLSDETTAGLVELALAIGESMAQRCIDEDRMLITRVVRSIVEGELAPSARPELLLNPADIDALRETFGEELQSGGWQLVADDKITRGGCLLRNDLSEIDATWETRWRAITSRLRSRSDATPAPASQSATAGDAVDAE